MAASKDIGRLGAALPYFLSFLLVPLIWAVAWVGGWWVLLVPLAAWYLFAGGDAVLGLNLANPDPLTDDSRLVWYKLGTWIWPVLQFGTLYGLIFYAARADHLGFWEVFGLFFGMGVISGTVGIVFAHELMHQRNRFERWLGDILMSMVLYSHFRSEHLLVHHRYVGTPRDPVTARFNEGFWKFYPRVLRESWQSSFRAEAELLARKDLPWTHPRNPFWRYWGLQALFLVLALVAGGWAGLAMFLLQAGTAIWQLEITNYVEHYGLTRKHLGDGKYEHVQPRHSWNAAQTATNWLLINLQRHSDHHYKPDRRFPLLQTYSEAEAPQLPHSYMIMTMVAMWPARWRRVMNPRVRAWRAAYYPEITDWLAYNHARNPMPR
ncbi:alkane 1-monooxygenase [Mesobacterium pallidum]|uniref:alkane 1-monooxygenase n=1 Tax=Mesobacterium pallidum TaxID=2872037 RepID=UPI001EE21997|nr:alkane 1-monooxygenase [Mesobacterium pallidum]